MVTIPHIFYSCIHCKMNEMFQFASVLYPEILVTGSGSAPVNKDFASLVAKATNRKCYTSRLDELIHLKICCFSC